MTIIEIRPFRNGWQVYSERGLSAGVFEARRRQIDYYRAGSSWLLFEGNHMVGGTTTIETSQLLAISQPAPVKRQLVRRHPQPSTLPQKRRLLRGTHCPVRRWGSASSQSSRSSRPSAR